MPVENRTLFQILALVLTVAVPLATASIVLFERLARLEERIESVRSNGVSYGDLENDVNALKAEVNNLKKNQETVQKDIKDNRKELTTESKSLQKLVADARIYVRDQLHAYRQDYHNLVVQHVMDTDLHTEQAKIKKAK